MIKDGTNFQPRQFEKNTVHPNQMRNLAMQELSGAPKRRRRTLRLMLPALLSGRATRDAKQMEEEMK